MFFLSIVLDFYLFLNLLNWLYGKLIDLKSQEHWHIRNTCNTQLESSQRIVVCLHGLDHLISWTVQFDKLIRYPLLCKLLHLLSKIRAIWTFILPEVLLRRKAMRGCICNMYRKFDWVIPPREFSEHKIETTLNVLSLVQLIHEVINALEFKSRLLELFDQFDLLSTVLVYLIPFLKLRLYLFDCDSLLTVLIFAMSFQPHQKFLQFSFALIKIEMFKTIVQREISIPDDSHSDLRLRILLLDFLDHLVKTLDRLSKPWLHRRCQVYYKTEIETRLLHLYCSGLSFLDFLNLLTKVLLDWSKLLELLCLTLFDFCNLASIKPLEGCRCSLKPFCTTLTDASFRTLICVFRLYAHQHIIPRLIFELLNLLTDELSRWQLLVHCD